MNPFVSRISGNSWVLPVAALSAVLVVLVKLAWITPGTVKSRSPYLPPDQASRVEASFVDVSAETKKVADEVVKLRGELTDLQNAMGSKTKETQVLNEALQNVKVFAGLTEVEGPGISVTLRDGRGSGATELDADSLTIHDLDVLKVVNELWNAGAEAISVNDQRVAAGSNIRCVGSTILVDNVRVAPPIVIRAIGDSKTLMGGMNIPMGILDELRSVDRNMVQLEKVPNMRLPAFAGSTERKVAKVPKDAQ